MTETALLTQDQVGVLLHVSTRQVRTWTSAGDLRCVRLGRLTRYRVDDVQAFVDAHTDDAIEQRIEDETLAAALLRLAGEPAPLLCPRCGVRPQGDDDETGWCSKCTEGREKELERKRKWWNEKGTHQRAGRSPGTNEEAV